MTTATEEMLILIDDEDRAIGVAEKINVHIQGLLHRAFSLFIFDPDGRLLLQQRAHDKYHSPGLWTNTCCGHPRPGESSDAAAHRRLKEEMGFDCNLVPVFSLSYRAHLPNGLIEHEYDHVYAGRFLGNPIPDCSEAANWKWVALPDLFNLLQKRPNAFTVWFKQIVNQVGFDGLAAWSQQG